MLKLMSPLEQDDARYSASNLTAMTGSIGGQGGGVHGDGMTAQHGHHRQQPAW